MIEMIQVQQFEEPDSWGSQTTVSDSWKEATYDDAFIPFRNFSNFLSWAYAPQIALSIDASKGTSSNFDLVILKPEICREKTGNQLLFEFRRLTSLTWDQIATLVGVSRRAVHHWAAGSKVSTKHHQKLGELVSTVRFVDRGFSEKNKDLLMNTISGRGTAFALLKAGLFEDVKNALGKGIDRPNGFPGLSDDSFAMTGRRSFGEQIEAAADSIAEIDENIQLINATGKRRAHARRAKS